ncbi:AmmeMemoRadiSam system protein A [Candidatus Albibeggiatoa sp. nov. BB20]|uniref:AmmeMemoRadiSam system protein A n=1 Tax=Candidatus Albibeggiatoa sp. nov. BB20 TaxID=3162723 RepID=UPI0033653542
MSLSNEHHKILLQTARASIKQGLEQGHPPNVNLSEYPAELRVIKACFVTLEIQHNLRGCIGALVANQSLIEEVACHAYAAAFDDPHFTVLQSREYALLSVHIAILSELEPMQFDSEHDLIRQLRPNIDGLVLEDKSYKSMFLPIIWKSQPHPQDFLYQLKRKAGLPTDYWSDSIKIQRYTTESFYN